MLVMRMIREEEEGVSSGSLAPVGYRDPMAHPYAPFPFAELIRVAPAAEVAPELMQLLTLTLDPCSSATLSGTSISSPTRSPSLLIHWR